ncbi:MAG: hypothetical protein LBF27_25565 [Sphingobacterium sp.]|jgi:hypothetical protein|nr:hypothetical protein [Sphingobacterium sp.]
MKKLLSILVLILCSLMSYSQAIKPSVKPGDTNLRSYDPISGFYGMDFGASAESCKNIMKSKGWVIKDDNGKSIIYKTNKFIGRDAVICLKFYNNELYEGFAMFIPDLESKVVDLYENISEDISLKFGEPSSYENYEYPYEKGDGHTVTAIQAGKAEFTSFWGKKINSQNAISLEISPNLSVFLTYQDSKRVYSVIKNQNEKKLNDL